VDGVSGCRGKKVVQTANLVVRIVPLCRQPMAFSGEKGALFSWKGVIEAGTWS
jgi:hypothetical protein